MDHKTQPDIAVSLKQAVHDTLAVIEQDREREIITRRFGLTDRRETLEQIGELLGITRERVRQLEKAILIRLKMAAEENKIPAIHEVERQIIRDLSENGRAARIHDLALRLAGKEADARLQAQIAFIAELSPKLVLLSENDQYYQAVGIHDYADEKKLKSQIDKIVNAIKKHAKPVSVEELHRQLDMEHPDHVRAMASLSKQLAHLKDSWGLTKWPTVNPKNIRDKIYVILAENSQPMHFSDIAQSIKASEFKRRNVTTQAIHNELIKDRRFVLIGRGIYALDNWGFSKGTVADIIAGVMREAGEPLHRDEIVRRVLKSRQVKETTILLNLQSKTQFKRVSKATYVLDEASK